MELDLQCVASFVVLSEELHFGRAAARQHLTTSALSKRIGRLERQIGVSVIVRGPSGVLELTAAGHHLAAEAVPLLAHADAVLLFARLDRLDRPTRLSPLGAAVPARATDDAGGNALPFASVP